MNRSFAWRSIAAAAVILGAAGCTGDLEVTNPNAPDAQRAYSDPATVAAVAGGSFRTFLETKNSWDTALLLNHMAESYAAAWNNFNIRYYTSMCSQTGAYAGQCDCPERCGWLNTLTANQAFQITVFWYGYYSALSSANDALIAIRQKGVIINDAEETAMVETAATMMQGMVFAELAKNYDQAFAVTDEVAYGLATSAIAATDLELIPAKAMRDTALVYLDKAYAMAKAHSFTTPSSWLGVSNGPQYTNNELAQVIATVSADLLAYFPRSSDADQKPDWSKVRDYATKGLSTRDFSIFQDQNFTFSDQNKLWSNSISTVRANERVGQLAITGEKAPWPVPQGNKYPFQADKLVPGHVDARVGDGSWCPVEDCQGVGTHAATDKAGTYFAFAGRAIQRAARGQYHQSNFAQIRYTYLTYAGSGQPSEDGSGLAESYSVDQNNLLLAEANLELGNNAAAATLINKTRVGHGKLPALTGGEGTAQLRYALQYEQELELMGLGAAPFYNRRRGTPSNWSVGGMAEWDKGTNALTGVGGVCPAILCLWTNSPRQMPLPAKELAVLKLELYSFGGVNNPSGYSAGINSSAGVRNVREIYSEMEAKSRAMMQARQTRK